MVLKLYGIYITVSPLFESDVISDGTQTFTLGALHHYLFESDVISDGTQTKMLLSQ